MVRRIDAEDLRAAWRALAGEAGLGWRTIPVASDLPVKVRAGRHFPGNEEALLVGFEAAQVPPTPRLPQGRGFLVSRVELGSEDVGTAWIALSRLVAGNIELFAEMAHDVLGVIHARRGTDSRTVLIAFLARIIAWQEFMERGQPPVLGPDAEVGIFGEILILRDLVASGIPPLEAVSAWKGPVRGLRDFEIKHGAIEVKSTLAAEGFPAKIGSLDQLDDSSVKPLFVAAVRLALKDSGQTLPALVGDVNRRLQESASALDGFADKLVRGGYLEAFAAHYERRFTSVSTRIIPVGEGFPRLIRGNIAQEVSSARYVLDIDRITTPGIELRQVLLQLGAI
jgi:hypothetical protein